eukprot:TRINITY_DN923_c0_g1_i13.p1 TRINITY_DN923_c0_g1~~TRINITY_DN923_c0_g1_i13.p1  ORF type:complete len:252 (+),score=38.63 TRINITY_DN923_c0_g1_i13:203-958(+)
MLMDVGINYLYPEDIPYTDKQKLSLACSATPYTSYISGDSNYVFTIKKFHPTDEKSVYYCYTHSRKRSSQNSGGPIHVSIVLVSELSYTDLFRKIIDKISREYFENDEQILEAVYHISTSWEPPIAGKLVHLPFFDGSIHYRIPRTNGIISDIEALDQFEFEHFKISLLDCFKHVLPHLHILWELVLLSQPILVISPNPAQCSEVCLGLLSLISPLEYIGDVRPYFTYRDPDFSIFGTKDIVCIYPYINNK